nr:hypothetical protein RKHAN_01875 [Rhizobium sp. Khangiran2]
MTEVNALAEQLKGLHPKTGKPVTVVGVDASGIAPRLVILTRGPDGIFAEVVDYVDHASVA